MGLHQDLRYSLRLIRRTPALSLCIVMLLALGIGLNTTIFSLLDALLLRPLPVSKPYELVRLVQIKQGLGPRSEFTYNTYRALQQSAKTFSSVFGYSEWNAAIRDASGAHRVRCQIVTGSFFTALGVRALYGRALTPTDELQASDSPPVVLNYSYWVQHFSGDPTVIGKQLTLQDRVFTIAGVMPQGFHGVQVESGPDMYVPLIAANSLLNETDLNSYRKLDYALVARIRPSVRLERARVEAETILFGAVEDEFHEQAVYWREGRFDLWPAANGVSLLRPKFRTALLLLVGCGGLLLLIVCANIGGLLLARTATRRGEIALRLAVGATAIRLARQWLTETLVLSAVGGFAGSCVAWIATPLVAQALPPLRDFDATILTLSLDLRPDTRLIGFSLLLCVVAALLAGLPAAFETTRADLHSALKCARATPPQRLRWALVTFQMGLCTFLLAAAALLVSTFHELRSLDPGFDRDHVVTFSVDPRMLNYTPKQEVDLGSRLLAAVRTLPGVESDAIAWLGLMRSTGFKTTEAPAGQKAPPNEFLNTSLNVVSPEYFDTMGIRLLAGRTFRPNEPKTSLLPVVVNHAFVRHFFPTGDPIGRKFGAGWNEVAKGDHEIIGVVSDAKYRSLHEAIPPTVYGFWTFDTEIAVRPFILHVRVRNKATAIIAPVCKALHIIDPRLPFYEIRTLAEEVDASLWAERLLAWLTAAFSIVAALLAAVGVYGAMANAIAQAKGELGIRMALGAPPAEVARLLSARPMVFSSVGMASGMLAFYLAAPLFTGVLYERTPRDPSALAGVAGTVLLIGLVSTLVAIGGVLRIDPGELLRGA